jgi:hypothetical protein
LVLEDFGITAPIDLNPQRPGADGSPASPRGTVMAEAVQTFARMFNLKPAPITRNPAPDQVRES